MLGADKGIATGGGAFGGAAAVSGGTCGSDGKAVTAFAVANMLIINQLFCSHSILFLQTMHFLRLEKSVKTLSVHLLVTPFILSQAVPVAVEAAEAGLPVPVCVVRR